MAGARDGGERDGKMGYPESEQERVVGSASFSVDALRATGAARATAEPTAQKDERRRSLTEAFLELCKDPTRVGSPLFDKLARELAADGERHTPRSIGPPFPTKEPGEPRDADVHRRDDGRLTEIAATGPAKTARAPASAPARAAGGGRAEQRAPAAKRRDGPLEGLLRSSSDPLVLIDFESGIVRDCNERFEELLVKPRDKIIGASQTELFNMNKGYYLQHMFKTHLKDVPAVQFNSIVIATRPSGGPSHVQVQVGAMLVRDEQGRAMVLGLLKPRTPGGRP